MAIDVSVQQADLATQLSQGQSQVDGHRGLADATLAGGHRDDLGGVSGLGEGDDAFGDAAAQLHLEGITLLVSHGAELDGNAGDPIDTADGLGHLLAQLSLEGASGHGQQDADEGASLIINGDLINHVEIGDGAFDLGVIDVRESFGNGLDQRVIGAHADLSTHRWAPRTTRRSRTDSDQRDPEGAGEASISSRRERNSSRSSERR